MEENLKNLIDEIKIHQDKLDNSITEILTKYPNIEIQIKSVEPKKCSLNYGLTKSKTKHIQVKVFCPLS